MNQETTMDYEITDGAREYKAGLPAGDAQDVYDAMMRTFEHFKSENDDRLKTIEKRGGNVIAEEKVARIDAALNAHQQRLDELSLKGARPALSAEHAVRLHGAKERKSAFDAYIRSGESAGPRQIETKAMSVGSSPDGGYLVPEETEIEIGKRLNDISPMRSICALRAISGSIYRKPFMITGPATGWVGKTTARPQTASPVLDELSFPAMELYALPAATSTLLEDSAVNIDEWLAGEVELTLRDAGRRGFHQWRRQQQAEGLSRLRHPAECIVDLGQHRLCGDRRGRGIPGGKSVGCADRPDLRAAVGLSAERQFRDEPQDAKFSSQVQELKRRLSLAAAGRRWRQVEPDRVSVAGSRGHAGRRGQLAFRRLRRFPPRLSDRGPPGRAGVARSVFGEAVCAVLHDEAGRRRRARL
jgi:hypothetical protein